MSSDRLDLSPGLDTFLASLKGRPAEVSVDNLITLLKRRSISGSRRCAIATANLLINFVASCRPQNPGELLERVQIVARRLVEAQPREIAVGNIARRVLGLIRDASEGGKTGNQEHTSVNAQPSSSEVADESSESTIKEDTLDGIRELLDELDQADKQISEYSTEQIYPGETILIVGASPTVQKFLLDAARRRKFNVLLAENYPREHDVAHQNLLHGALRDSEAPASAQNRLRTLTAAGLSVTFITDSQIFAMMSLVSKIILSAQCIFSNGGCVTLSGSKSVTSIAKFYRVPVVVLSAIYRLSPSFPYDPKSLVERSNLNSDASFADAQMVQEIELSGFHVDYVSPELVSLYVTNIGSCAPNQIHRVVADHYRRQDTDI